MNERVPPARLRASDADRERVLRALREAAEDGRLDLEEFSERSDRVHEARTLGELPEVTRDLLPPERQPLRLDTAPVSALFRNDGRAGRWVVHGDQVVYALFGSAEVDLCDALLTRNTVRMTASALFGRIEIRVPEGMEVRVRGWSFLGLRTTSTRPSPVPDAPVLEIEGFSLFGSLRVSAPRRRRRWLRRSPKPRELG
ncbi:DUF1707 SHOCT-like domain-containing protein [Actinorugispora endophytica]|uniref:Cell wall-active antibiotic response 4TMS protein YvqF n=1 Tax=Actinorugispora endophytica TaxID=1605990 RepID=A0A4R6V7U7_9ACTN|nr:DUF1707 domain-containing protein [Actinorugispora endophytica]TDQ54808.1 cell wall-active antibiotic response 4TMS protein YvqF [Actinorugispora endophytica]